MCQYTYRFVLIFLFCAFFRVQADAQLNPIKDNSRQSRASGFSCTEIDIAVVTDLAYEADPEELPEIRKRILDMVSNSQTYFQNFDVQINFRVQDIFLPVNEYPFPLYDDVRSFGEINTFMNDWLVKQGHPASEYDITIAMTTRNYPTGPIIGQFIGDPFSIGSVIIELQNSESLSKSLLTHELGHAFGASHDAVDFTYIMSPTITGSGAWSLQSKDQINATLAQNDMMKYFSACPSYTFTAAANGKEISLGWDIDFETEVVSYVLYENGVVIDTIAAKGNPSHAAHYDYLWHTDKSGTIGYRLDQLSKFNYPINQSTASATVGIKEDVVFSAYPNPFQDSLRITLPGPAQSLYVFNALGQRLTQYEVSGDGITFDTTTWPVGIYFIRRGNNVLKVIRHER